MSSWDPFSASGDELVERGLGAVTNGDAGTYWACLGEVLRRVARNQRRGTLDRATKLLEQAARVQLGNTESTTTADEGKAAVAVTLLSPTQEVRGADRELGE